MKEIMTTRVMLCIRGILYITFIHIIWLPYQPCGMDWTAYLLFQTGKINFIEFKGLAQCHTAGLSQGWITRFPASVLFLLLYGDHPPSLSIPHALSATPVTWHPTIKSSHLVFIVVPSCGLLNPSSLPQ